MYLDQIIEEVKTMQSNKCILALSINNETKAINAAICYSIEDKKEAIKGLINSMYWNSTPKNWESGTEIVKENQFLAIDSNNIEEKEWFLRQFNELHYYLTHLDLKIAGKTATAIENIIYKQAKKYNQWKKF